jgi:hypothetical protein
VMIMIGMGSDWLNIGPPLGKEMRDAKLSLAVKGLMINSCLAGGRLTFWPTGHWSGVTWALPLMTLRHSSIADVDFHGSSASHTIGCIGGRRMAHLASVACGHDISHLFRL